jgi:DNA-binding YbaB/EbfC family protein
VSDLPDMDELLRQAMAMQEQLAAAQDRARETVVEGRAGGGSVRVSMTGGGEVTAVRIDPEVVDPSDVEMLEDLVLAAVRDALHQVQELQSAALGGLGNLGDLGGLGGLTGLPVIDALGELDGGTEPPD